MLSLSGFLLVCLWGGWVAVDTTSLGQIMISRPLVAATVAGALLGDPAAGAAIGLVLEAFNLMVLPVGASRYPEAGPASVVAGAGYALFATPGALLTCVVFSLAYERVGGETVRALRQFNTHIALTPDSRSDPANVQRQHLVALSLDWLRGTALVALGLAGLVWLLPWVAAHWMLPDNVVRVAVAAGVAGALAATLQLFRGGNRVLLFAAGVGAGLLLGVFR